LGVSRLEADLPPTNLAALEAHHKKDIKEERVILDLMKDPLIPYLYKKKMTKDMFDALVGLFQSTNMNRKMVLRNIIGSMNMYISDNVTIYIMKIT